MLLLDGLGDLGPQIQAAMGTAEERFVEIAKSVFKLTGGSLEGIEEMKLIWTRERWLEGYTGEGDDQ
ncbi:MAG: hypothetical protein OXU64_00140 [Gemmatimonadota bacterium]|nr:hypothetical protein [Gemmatimonadota bacterium]